MTEVATPIVPRVPDEYDRELTPGRKNGHGAASVLFTGVCPAFQAARLFAELPAQEQVN